MFNPDRLARLLYPSTLAIAGSVTVFLIILSVLVRVRATYPLDLGATLYLQRLGSTVLDAIARWLTFMGNALTMIVLALALAGYAAVAKEPRTAIFLLLSLVALPINAVLKKIFSRERPGENEAKIHPGPRWGFSFPSGHSMGSMAFYGFLCFAIWLYTPSLAVKTTVVSLIMMMTLGVGLSRIYLGAHWLSDVVAGWALGGAIVVILGIMYPL